MKKFVAACIVLLSALVAVPAAAADPTPSKDPKLAQTVSAEEANASGRVELAKGHVDVGPRITDKGWELLARDDTKNPPQWRNPAEMVIRVHDAALLEIPGDKQYAFLGIPAGAKAHVIPQTQNPDVVWLGWNTQDPKVTQTIERGAKLVFHRHQGPGTFHVFLQNGFDAPQPLWDGAGADGQEIWVDVNTHTHANWVFSAPGVHLVDMEVVAKGLDGAERRSRATLRFAVGDAVSLDDAFAASLPPAASASAASATPTQAPATAAGTSSSTPWVVVGVLAALVVIGAGVAFVLARGRREKAAALVDGERADD